MSLEGIYGLPQVNNSNKGDGAMLKEIVKGTFDSDGHCTVNTQLTRIDYHTIGYVFNAAICGDGVNCDQVVAGTPNTVLVHGTASQQFAGELCGRSFSQE